jgi:ABC-type histidine transport system ATPase subunit
MFCGMKPYIQAVHRRFGETHCLYLKGRRLHQARSKEDLLGILVDTEDGRSAFLRNFNELLPAYTVSQLISKCSQSE